MSTIEELSNQGIAAARAGRREEARELLMQVVEADERNEQAWLWLAGVIEDPEDMRTCLENVLDINPNNVKAQQGLAWINQRYGPPVEPSQPAQPPIPPHPASVGATIRLSDEAATTAQTMRSTPAESGAPPSPPAAETLPAAPVSTAVPVAIASHAPTSDPSAAALPANSYPCPYCGAVTTLNQTACPQCRSSLMIRTESREKRSISVTILGWLHGISGFFTLLAGVAAIVGTLLLTNNSRVSLPPVVGNVLMFIAVFIFLLGVVYIAVARGLLRRARWAYIVVVILTIIGTIGTLYNAITGVAMSRALDEMSSSPELSELPPQVMQMMTTISLTSVIVGLVIQALVVLMVVISYRDFFGPMARFVAEIEPVDHMKHYNNGVAYKDRGMWYMAAKEWEAAVKKSPRDARYLHALGLAYAQIKQFDQARTTLDAALQFAPEQPQIAESRALIEQLASKAPTAR